jgi:hypothetical protein
VGGRFRILNRDPRPAAFLHRASARVRLDMPTGAPHLVAQPLHAAVAFAQFGVPDGYVTPHDSPAAYARAVEAARGRVAAT